MSSRPRKINPFRTIVWDAEDEEGDENEGGYEDEDVDVAIEDAIAPASQSDVRLSIEISDNKGLDDLDDGEAFYAFDSDVSIEDGPINSSPNAHPYQDTNIDISEHIIGEEGIIDDTDVYGDESSNDDLFLVWTPLLF